ncbi:hypothetical protein [Viridibacillus arvi]|uniref:hypothetical protein n=1 Tax=Viridibacillus arvi TaxID=263475 RepID=UPI0036E45AAE
MKKNQLNFFKMMLALVVVFAFAFGALTTKTKAATTTEVDTVTLTNDKSKTLDRKFNMGTDIIKVTVPADGLLTMKLNDPKEREIALLLVNEFDTSQLEDIKEFDLSALEKLESTFNDVELFGYAINSELTWYDPSMHSISVGLKKGTYYLLAYKLDFGKNKGYSTKLSFKAGSNYEKESNNSASKATPINLNKTYNASFNLIDEDDYYKVTVPQAGFLKVYADQKHSTKFKMKVLDDKKKAVKGLKVTKDKRKYTGSVYLPKGTYYVKVSADMMDSLYDSVSYTLKTSVKSTKLKSSAVKVINKKGTKNDKVLVSNLKAGTTVKVYADASKKKLVASAVSTTDKATMKLKTLSSKGGKLYITVKKPSISESIVLKVNY